MLPSGCWDLGSGLPGKADSKKHISGEASAALGKWDWTLMLGWAEDVPIGLALQNGPDQPQCSLCNMGLFIHQ